MSKLVIGPRTRVQLARLNAMWRQGEHVVITGGTGSGKTRLARELVQMRIDRGGSVIVFMAKTRPDSTITEDYKGFTRWKRWHTKQNITERKVLLWPDVQGKSYPDAIRHMREVYTEALEEISKVGKWTVVIDEGLLTTSPNGLNQGAIISQMFQLIRSAHGTMIVLAQRPAHLPLSIFANVDHAFVSRASEVMDLKRLADMNSNSAVSSKELANMIRHNGKHDFTWIAVGAGQKPETVNLAR